MNRNSEPKSNEKPLEEGIKFHCFQDTDILDFVQAVVDRLETNKPHPSGLPVWINSTQLMDLLQISSKTTLQRILNLYPPRIVVSRVSAKLHLYNRDSALALLEERSSIKI